MKKFYLSLLLSGFLSNLLFAQTRKYCHTDEVYWETVRTHPEILDAQRQLEDFTKRFEQTHTSTPGARTASTIYVIPVVFHVIHEYGSENISDDQIKKAIDILNSDYGGGNFFHDGSGWDTTVTIADFKGRQANIGIQFKLATLDPNGNCTNGIDRIASFRTNLADDNSKLNPWPNNKYLNIWTVKAFGPLHASAAGYTTYPGGPAVSDGVIILANYVGYTGTSIEDNARALTHEIGHFLNLQHPWGNTNSPGVACGDDGVSDTPITKGWRTCPTSGFDVCNVGVNENFQNFMDYSYCSMMFTEGQKTRMLVALNTSTSGRNHLWISNNLDSTGTTGVASLPCAPIADFYPYANHICSGDSIQYINASFNTDTFNYEWSFPLGVSTSSTLKNPFVKYTSPGQYTATLKAFNAQGADSLTKTLVMNVSGTTSYTPTYFNDFEAVGAFPDADGYVINNFGNTWQLTSVGYSGTKSIKMTNYASGQVQLYDSWVTPSMDFTGFTSPVLTFRMAYARKDVAKVDVLAIYSSVNCGKSWTLRRSLSASQLATVANVSGSYTPASTADWALVTVSPLSTLNNKSNVRFKFEFLSAGDNNLYIDDVNLAATPVGIEEAAVAALSFDVYPNPSTDFFNIAFDMPSSDKGEVKITDILGREMKTVVKDRLSAGPHEYTLNSKEFSPGIYLVTLNVGEISAVKKLIVD